MNWILAHPLQIIVFYWVFSAIVSGMPDPSPSSSVTYVWTNRSLHILAGNVAVAMQSRYPSLLPPSPTGSTTTTTVGILTEQRSETAIPNNGK